MSPLPTSAGQSENRTKLRSRRRRVLFVTFTAFVLLGFYNFSAGSLHSDNVSLFNPFNILSSLWTALTGCNSQMSSTVASSAEGWHSRIRGEVDPTEFSPTKSDLVLTVLFSSQVEPQGFTMALLRPSSVVDASGRVYTMAQDDFAAFEETIEAVKALPHADGFRGQWRVSHPRTSYPIDRILIPHEPERGVYGWDKHMTSLEQDTKGYTHLPDEMQRLVGWAREARTGYVRGTRDESVIEQVMALV